MYSFIQKILFLLDPELSHSIALKSLKLLHKLGLLRLVRSMPKHDEIELMGIRFPNRVGLAAGLDKNGDYIDALGALGFGFIEIGTITPIAQAGNEKPRLFRLNQENAIINRMGFNNKGVAYLVERVKRAKYNGVLGINIGKNKVTPDDAALLDYERCMDLVYEHADYITVNISSPNTPGLRNLQYGERFNDLLSGIKRKQAELAQKFKKYVPVAVKVAPDMSEAEIDSFAECVMKFDVDGVIATNTTISRDKVQSSVYKDEAGGLSGRPLTEMSTQVITRLVKKLEGRIPVIGVGGVFTREDAKAKFAAGASLVQVYSGFIYRGPELVKEVSEAGAAAL